MWFNFCLFLCRAESSENAGFRHRNLVDLNSVNPSMTQVSWLIHPLITIDVAVWWWLEHGGFHQWRYTPKTGYLVGGFWNINFKFSHLLGLTIPIAFHIFQRGRYTTISVGWHLKTTIFRMFFCLRSTHRPVFFFPRTAHWKDKGSASKAARLYVCIYLLKWRLEVLYKWKAFIIPYLFDAYISERKAVAVEYQHNIWLEIWF